MLQQMVNATWWVDIRNDYVAPDLWAGDLALVNKCDGFCGDGIYLLKNGRKIEPYRCFGHQAITISQNDPLKLRILTRSEFSENLYAKIVYGIREI